MEACWTGHRTAEGKGGNVSFHWGGGASFLGLSIASGISEYTGTLKRMTPAASDSNTCLTFIKMVIAVIWTLFTFRWYHWGTRDSGSLKLIARVKC